MMRLDPATARARLHSGAEIALLDVREAGQFGEGHPLFAVPAPYSRLEAMVPRLVPRRTAAIMLIDDGDGVAERAAARLSALGFAAVALVEGGVQAWEATGFPLYKGVNVPSKALGELAEAIWHPETLTAEELAEWRARGEDFALFDARPPSEHAKMRVPGARCLPNGELAHRLAAVAPERGPIVITCAGRTRGLTGAIGLRVAGYNGRVLALENGTQGWALAGHELERGAKPAPFPEIDATGLADARERARALIGRAGIPLVDARAVAAMAVDSDRTTYLFDVRSAPEAEADPLPAVHAPSGQLVQATDQWVGVRHARLVLCDDSGLRAALAAFWLKQLGYEPFVAVIDNALRGLPPASSPEIPTRATRLAPENALCRLDQALLLDLRSSMDYRREHVPGAVWSVRPRLPAVRGRDVIIVADEPAVADMAALDLAECGARSVALAEGGLPALVAAGATVEPSPAVPCDADAIDHLFFVHDRHDGNLDASRRYLAWETGLVAQFDAPERQEFRLIYPD
jgi:rhodanese-related sulfurtransferase